MPPEDKSEFDLIRWIRERTPSATRIPLGIGDDCAVIKLSSTHCLLTVDQVVEGIHFDLQSTTPERAGRKALARALSDIAAMAALPSATVACMLLPKTRGMDCAKRLYSGMRALADEFDAPIIGGDISVGGERLVISVTVLGEPRRERWLTRAGAGPGDVIFVTGELGGSLLGKHLTFVPRIREALDIADSLVPTAMIDISDGLAADLGHILEESGAGAELDAGSIPISADAHSMAESSGGSPLDHALFDGEDYELLFCVSPETADRAPANLADGLRLTRIGVITEGNALILNEGGVSRKLEAGGWKHIIG